MIRWTIFESTSQRIIMFSVHVFAKSIKCFFEAMTTSFWMVKSGQMIHRHINFKMYYPGFFVEFFPTDFKSLYLFWAQL